MSRILRGVTTVAGGAIGLLCLGAAYAADVTFAVQDQSGNHVDDAVVVLSSPSIATEPHAAVTVVMDQVEKRFVPAVLAIHVGDSVRFPNSDDIRHHVYSFSTPNNFELPLYSGEPNDPVQFQEAGTVVVGCNIHDLMQAWIYIGDNVRQAVTTSGSARFEALPEETLTVTVYHPRAKHSPALTLELPPDQWHMATPLGIELLPADTVVDTSTMSALQLKFHQLRNHQQH